MKLTGLSTLYYDMKAKGLDRERFRYTHNVVQFDVFFLTDDKPFKLWFGAIAHNFSFKLDVRAGFEISIELPNETYTKLCKALELQYDINNKFKPLNFFKEFNNNIPQIAKNGVKPHEIARYIRNVEEADKKFFIGWLDNSISNKHVSKNNLFKTKEILGIEAYLFCKKNNISSRWTDIEALAIDYYHP